MFAESHYTNSKTHSCTYTQNLPIPLTTHVPSTKCTSHNMATPWLKQKNLNYLFFCHPIEILFFCHTLKRPWNTLHISIEGTHKYRKVLNTPWYTHKYNKLPLLSDSGRWIVSIWVQFWLFPSLHVVQSLLNRPQVPLVCTRNYAIVAQ